MWDIILSGGQASDFTILIAPRRILRRDINRVLRPYPSDSIKLGTPPLIGVGRILPTPIVVIVRPAAVD